MAPRVKIEEVLPSGEKVTITIEGRQLSKTRVLQVLEMISIMSGAGISDEEVEEGENVSVKEKVWDVIVERFGDGSWFTLKELYNAVAEEEPDLKVTTLASYLAKFVSEGRLLKKGQRPTTMYRVRMNTVRARD